MKRKSAEIKRIARENLTGHYGLPMGAMVVSQLIVTLPTMFFSWNLTPYSGKMEWAIYYVAAFILTLLGVVLNIGILRIALRMGRKQPYKFTDMFYGFNHHENHRGDFYWLCSSYVCTWNWRRSDCIYSFLKIFHAVFDIA